MHNTDTLEFIVDSAYKGPISPNRHATDLGGGQEAREYVDESILGRLIWRGETPIAGV